MLRALAVVLLLTGTAMAKPDESRQADKPPTRAEMALWMWRTYAGDKPIPVEWQREFNLMPDGSPAKGERALAPPDDYPLPLGISRRGAAKTAPRGLLDAHIRPTGPMPPMQGF